MPTDLTIFRPSDDNIARADGDGVDRFGVPLKAGDDFSFDLRYLYASIICCGYL